MAESEFLELTLNYLHDPRCHIDYHHSGEPPEFTLTHCRPPNRPTTLTSNLNDRLSVAYLRFQMILSAIFVMLCLCDICCYVDKKQNRRLGRLVEPSGLINNHTERPLRTRNQSKMSHFVATV